MNLESQNKALAEANEMLALGIKAMDRLSEIRKGLIDHKSQLIDGGADECSITVSVINQLIQKTDVRN